MADQYKIWKGGNLPLYRYIPHLQKKVTNQHFLKPKYKQIYIFHFPKLTFNPTVHAFNKTTMENLAKYYFAQNDSTSH